MKCTSLTTTPALELPRARRRGGAWSWPALLLALCCCALPAFAQQFLAEWNASASGGVGPTGLALATESGTTYLYATDDPRGRIVKFDTATGAVSATFGQVGNANGQFNRPYGVAVDPASGDLYVTERGNHRVQRITNSGTFVMTWGSVGSAAGQFNEPIGVAVDAAGDVYVVEHGNHRVQKFHVTQSGGAWSATQVAMWGSQGSGNGQFNGPYGIAIDATGSVFVADGQNGRVQRFSSSGVFQSSFGTAGSGPGQFIIATWIGFAPNGDLLVTSTNSDPQNAAAADVNNQWVSRFTSSGTFVSRFGGTFGQGPGEFRLPFSAVVGANNRAYVADYYNSRVQVFDLTAAPTTTPPPTTPPPATAPAVASFTVGTTTATSVTFQLTFNEAVTGVDNTDFSAVTTGGAAATIGAVAGSGASYSIPVTFTGTGTIQLNLKASGTGIADASGAAMATGAAGPTFTIPSTTGGPGGTGGTADTTPPTVSTFTVGSNTATSVTFQIAFSENVTGVDAADFTATTAGGATATIGTVTGSGASYSMPVTFAGTGTIQLNLKSSGTGITDASGNAIATGASGPTFTIPTAGGGTGGSGGTTAGAHVVSITPPSNGSYSAGQFLSFTVNFSENVSVVIAGAHDDAAADREDDGERDDEDAAAPFFTWSAVAPAGARADSGTVAYVSGSGSSALLFRYRVKKDDSAPNGILLGTTLQLPPGATMVDASRKPLGAAALKLTWAQNPLTGVTLGGANADSETIKIHVGPGLVVGEPITLPATTPSGTAITWVLVSGNATLNKNILTPKNKGTIVLRAVVAGAAGSEMDFDAKEKHDDRLVNLSARLRVAGGDPSHAVFAGFVVTGSAPKQILIRAVGPGLIAFGITEALGNPRLQLRDAKGALLADNAGWGDRADIATAGDRVGAFKLTAGSHDAAVLVPLAPGAYTAQVASSNAGGQTGITLLEVYDVSAGTTVATEQLINLSTRGFVDTGDGQLVAGFVVAGDTPKRVLIRGIGPGLAAFGVGGTVADPMLKLFAAGGTTVLAQNDNWQTPQRVNVADTVATSADIAAAAAATGAFPLAANSRDAALLVTLAPGNYTAMMSGANNSTGAGLIEVYQVPPGK